MNRKTQFLDLLTEADLSQAQLARIFCMSARQINKWASGETDVPEYAIAYLTLYTHLLHLVDDVKAKTATR